MSELRRPPSASSKTGTADEGGPVTARRHTPAGRRAISEAMVAWHARRRLVPPQDSRPPNEELTRKLTGLLVHGGSATARLCTPIV